MKLGSFCGLFGISLLAIMMVAMLYIIVMSQQPKCELVKEEPEYDLKKLNATLSSDGKTMVKFAGHLQYVHDEPSESKGDFMALEFDSVAYSVSSKEKGTSFLVMETNCSSINVTLQDKASTQTATLIKLTLDVPNNHEAECEVVPQGITAKAGEHYKCEKKKTYECHSLDPKAKSKSVVKMIVTKLEFEVNGNAFVHRKGNFTTNSTLCA